MSEAIFGQLAAQRERGSVVSWQSSYVRSPRVALVQVDNTRIQHFCIRRSLERFNLAGAVEYRQLLVLEVQHSLDVVAAQLQPCLRYLPIILLKNGGSAIQYDPNVQIQLLNESNEMLSITTSSAHR